MAETLGRIIGEGVAGIALLGGVAFYASHEFDAGETDVVKGVTPDADASESFDFQPLERELEKIRSQFLAVGAREGILKRVKNEGFEDRAYAYEEDPACKVNTGFLEEDGLVFCDSFEDVSGEVVVQRSLRSGVYSVFPIEGSNLSRSFACLKDDAACNQVFVNAIAESFGDRIVDGVPVGFSCALTVNPGSRSDYLALNGGEASVKAYVVGVSCTSNNSLSKND